MKQVVEALVIPAKAGIHEHRRIGFSTVRVHGFRPSPE
jgi:hypothetical protein